MAYRCIDPLTEPMTAEPFWIEFITQVTVYIVHDHKKEKYIEMKRVDRNRKQENCKNARFYHRFERMERISRPRRGIGRMMVHNMKNSE